MEEAANALDAQLEASLEKKNEKPTNGTSTGPISPSDEDLKNSIIELRASPLTSTLGIPKLLPKILEKHPNWTVSEKRLRKLIGGDKEHLGPVPETWDYWDTVGEQRRTLYWKEGKGELEREDRLEPPEERGNIVAHGLVNEELENFTKELTKGKVVNVFEEGKGRGLRVADGVEVDEEEVLFTEDAKVWVPMSRNLSKGIMLGEVCASCGKIFGNPRSKILVSCQYHSRSPSSTTGPAPCHTRFCNRVCQAKSAKEHGPFICPTRNPEYAFLCRWAEDQDWRAPIVVFKIWASIIMRWKEGGIVERGDWDAFTMVSERVRRMREMGIFAEYQLGNLWKSCFLFLLNALHLPSAVPTSDAKNTPAAQYFQAFFGQTSFPFSSFRSIFTYYTFQRDLGLVTLNQEDDGGLYALHSSLNHSCDPTAAVRRTSPKLSSLGQEARPSRVHIVSRKNLGPGTPLTVSYVDPKASLLERRNLLRRHYIFECDCERCEREISELEVDDEEREKLRRGENRLWKNDALQNLNLAMANGNGTDGVRFIKLGEEGSEEITQQQLKELGLGDGDFKAVQTDGVKQTKADTTPNEEGPKG
ncbi:hypothetical protein BT69DRAFT_1348070 [Atractiella rhizophila]|nr:hypothetical protein BT69DRAFT_1348070 [Atractiella rhizophila]